jgi:hypothetical protein
MKTEDLIAALSADTTSQPTMGARLLRTMPVAVLVALVAVVALWKVRPDLAAALASPALIKTAMPAVLALAALWLARGLSRPESRARAQWAVVLVLLAGCAVALVQGLMLGGMSGLMTALDTPNLLTCFLSIPVLSALPLAAVLWSMNSGAPSNPRLAGAAAGLLAGAAGTAVYSLHCPEDALLFFAPAYGMNVLIMVGAGTLLGPRWLRW